MLPAFAMAIVVSSCKTDSEDDYLAYLESLNDTIDDSQSTDIDDDTNYVVLNEIAAKTIPTTIGLKSTTARSRRLK